MMGCCGTDEESIIWCNSSDTTGLIFVAVVWLLFIFSIIVVVFIGWHSHVDIYNGSIINILIVMCLWSHLKTVFSDPGTVPVNAHPTKLNDTYAGTIAMCGRCNSYKPPKSHHDRVSNRCISRMDHFCPWTNNSIGAKNQKHFFLFLIYGALSSSYFYGYLSIHLAFCEDLGCSGYEGTTLVLARTVIFVLLFATLFTFSMIVNQVYGLISGIGTIDRMKLKGQTLPKENPTPFVHVFGSNWWVYLLPVDPVFENVEDVLHYRLGEGPYFTTSNV